MPPKSKVDIIFFYMILFKKSSYKFHISTWIKNSMYNLSCIFFSLSQECFSKLCSIEKQKLTNIFLNSPYIESNLICMLFFCSFCYILSSLPNPFHENHYCHQFLFYTVTIYLRCSHTFCIESER